MNQDSNCKVGKNGHFNIKLAPIIKYDYIAKKIIEHADVRINVVSPRKLRWILTRYNLPKEICPRIIDEMVALGLIKKNNKREYELLTTNLDKYITK